MLTTKGQVVYVTGVPGSGKSFLAKQLKLETYCPSNGYDSQIFSTDNYWIRPDGQYDWNYKYCEQAHKWNQEQVDKFFEYKDFYFTPVAIIDNTNLTRSDIRPYLDICKKYQLGFAVYEPETTWRYDVEECFKRNQHGVPLQTIRNMLNKKVASNQLIEYGVEYLKNE